MTDDLSTAARLLYEAGTLKQARPTGWWMAGVRDPESVAEHSWRTSLIASAIAKLEGADRRGRRSSRCGTTPRRPAPEM